MPLRRAIAKIYDQYVWRPVGSHVASRLRVDHPSQAVVLAFLVGCLVGTGLLALPAATESGAPAPLLTALFTSVSAICVTGLVVVDTPTYWSNFGEVVILLLIQVGGFGILTLASLLGLSISRRFGIRGRLATHAETPGVNLGDLPAVLRGVLIFTLIFEGLAMMVLTARFLTGYDMPLPTAVYHGLFHAVSSFNSAGFVLYSSNFVPFVTDPVILITLALASIAGGLGFPVLLDLFRRRENTRRWLLHTKLTMLVSAVLLLVGTMGILLFEWSNPATLGPLSTQEKLVPAFFHSVQPRSSGFNSLNVGAMTEPTLLLTQVLMFIGGGSAGTAGGIKVTTLAILLLVIYAEARGRGDVQAFGRRIGGEIQRQALSITLLGLSVCLVGTLILLSVTRLSLSAASFETVSAFGTVGLSTGITPGLPPIGQFVLIILMFIGRVGPVTVASALAARERRPLYKLPEERTIVG